MKGYVNGSLWTIPVEASLYACVAFAGVLRLFRAPKFASFVVACVFAWLILWPMYTGKYRWTGIDWMGLVLAGFFGAGSIACLLRRYLPISTGLMIAILAAALLARSSTHAIPFMWLSVGYFALWLAYVPRLPQMPSGIDVSYGVYLWAFPVQQVLISIGIDNVFVLFATAVPIVLAIAYVSWIWIEKPALRLKEWGAHRTQVAHAVP